MKNDNNLLALVKILANERLDAREYAVIYKRYFEGKTLEQVGKEFNITRERVRQIEHKGLMKLRLVCEEYQKDVIKEEIRENMTYDVALQVLTDMGYFETTPPRKVRPIDELDLSVRSYHGLKRIGINTIEELMTKTLEDLTKIRNLGHKSVNEIVIALNKKGLHLKYDE